MLTTNLHPENLKKLHSCTPRGATAQLSPSDHATTHATAAQPASLKALASKHLPRNSPRNFDATEAEKAAQLLPPKNDEKVARVAAEIAPEKSALPDPLIDAAILLCLAYGDDETAMQAMLDDLAHYPITAYDWLIEYFLDTADRLMGTSVEVWRYDNRRSCNQCLELAPNGRCRAAARNELRHATTKYAPTLLDRMMRCEGYLPKSDDPDQRPGRERWAEVDHAE